MEASSCGWRRAGGGGAAAVRQQGDGGGAALDDFSVLCEQLCTPSRRAPALQEQTRLHGAVPLTLLLGEYLLAHMVLLRLYLGRQVRIAGP